MFFLSIALAWALSLVTSSLLRALLIHIVLAFMCLPSRLAPVKSISINFQISLWRSAKDPLTVLLSFRIPKYIICSEYSCECVLFVTRGVR